MPAGPHRPHAARGRHVRRTYWRRRAAVALAVLVVAAAAGYGVDRAVSGPGGPGPARGTAAGATTTTSGRGTGTGKGATARTFLASDGISSPATMAENAKPGTTAWQLSAPAAAGTIEGFAGTTYAAAGQTVTLYVSTTAPQFTVAAYRMGYYQGSGGRLVWQSGPVAGQVQPTCPLTAGVNMVSCDNWSPSLTIRITAAFVQGDYLLKLTGSGNQQSYVLLTVWAPSSTAAYLVMSRSMTEEGWNTFGGYSFYEGQGPCTLGQTGSYPPCNRARVVSFDRPFTTGNGASDFLSNEYPLVRFMEQHGLDAAYVTDVTVDAHPTVLLNHRALLSLGHDETWTSTERQAATTALAHGVNIAFLGAAPLVRHARLQPSPLGPDRQVVDYRNSSEDPLDATGPAATVTGNTFATPPTSEAVSSFVGAEYSGYLTPGAQPVPFVVQQPTAWIFKGTGLHQGSSIPGVNLSDINHADPATAPSDLEVLGHSPVPLSEAYTNQGSWGGNTYADMTYYTDPTSRGGVFQSGTVNWIFAVNACAPAGGSCTDAAVATITGNLLWLFGQGPAGALEPSVPNLSSVSPAGS